MPNNNMQDYFERYTDGRSLLTLDEAKAVAIKLENNDRARWSIVDDPTIYDALQCLSLEIKRVLSLKHKCIFCSTGAMSYLGMYWFTPTSKPNGVDTNRVILYQLCDECNALPDRDDRIECRMSADVEGDEPDIIFVLNRSKSKASSDCSPDLNFAAIKEKVDAIEKFEDQVAYVLANYTDPIRGFFILEMSLTHESPDYSPFTRSD